MIFQASEVVQLSGMGVAVMIQQMSRNLESFFNCYMQDGIEKKIIYWQKTEGWKESSIVNFLSLISLKYTSMYFYMWCRKYLVVTFTNLKIRQT